MPSQTQTAQLNQTTSSPAAQSNVEIETAIENFASATVAIELEKIDHNHRVYLVLQFLSWEVYKVVIPLMYLASVYIIMNSDNRMWMGGLGKICLAPMFLLTRPYSHLSGRIL